MTAPEPPAHWFRVLLRLQLIQLGSVWRAGRGEPVLILGGLVGLVAAGAAIHRAAGLVQALGGLAPLVAAGAAAGLVGALWPAAGSGDRQALLDGPFQPWLAAGRRLALWSAARTAVLATVVIALITLSLAVTDPRLVPGWISLALIGAVAALAWRTASDPSPARAGAVVRPGPAAWQPTPRAPPRTASAAAYLAQLKLTRPVNGLPAWLACILLLALASAAGGLAARNNGDPQIGFVVTALGAVAAGLILGEPDLDLIRLIGHAPVGLARLYGVCFAWPVLACGLGGLAAAAAARLPLALCLATGGVVAAGLGLWWALILLHGLARGRQAAQLAAVLDLVVAVMLLVTFAPAVLPWLALRAVMLTRSARRGRWSER